MSTENLGRAPSVQVSAIQHRGAPEFTKEQLNDKYRVVRVDGERVETRKARPHEYRNNTTESFGFRLCNLCSMRRVNEIHRL